MRQRLRTLVMICAIVSVGVSLSACDQRGSAGATVTPHGQGSDSELQPEGEFEGETINELALKLEHLVAERDLQISVANQDTVQCEGLCELSRAICEVKTKMCDIADEHVADGEYQNLCRKAKQRCREASDSCVRCVQHHQQAGTDCAGAGDVSSTVE